MKLIRIELKIDKKNCERKKYLIIPKNDEIREWTSYIKLFSVFNYSVEIIFKFESTYFWFPRKQPNCRETHQDASKQNHFSREFNLKLLFPSSLSLSLFYYDNFFSLWFGLLTIAATTSSNFAFHAIYIWSLLNYSK